MAFWRRNFWRRRTEQLPEQPEQQPERSQSETYGFSADDPILCNGPWGEQEYLAALRCPGGHPLEGQRRGSVRGKCTDPVRHVTHFEHEKPAEFCLVDDYAVACSGGEFSCHLYFDMYHPKTATRSPPNGLTRVL
jgi:hypothetical protein